LFFTAGLTSKVSFVAPAMRQRTQRGLAASKKTQLFPHQFFSTQMTQTLLDFRRFFSLLPSAPILTICVICVLMDDANAKTSLKVIHDLEY